MPNQPTPSPGSDAADPRPQADPLAQPVIPPYSARSLLALVESRGLSADRLCRGLGFDTRDLMEREPLLSHLQMRELVARARRALGPLAPIGLASGGRQTPLSWGLAGLVMLTCETLGEAIICGLKHQQAAGAMLTCRLSVPGREAFLDVQPRVFDLELEPFLVEETFAGAVAIFRRLVGDTFEPLRVDLGFAPDTDLDDWRRCFRCPIRPQAGASRLVFEAHWLQATLPGHDRFTARLVRSQLEALLCRTADPAPPAARPDWRNLGDEARYARARELLSDPSRTMPEIAQAVGYADARAFRRAFKRWSGQLPTAYRVRALANRGLAGADRVKA